MGVEFGLVGDGRGLDGVADVLGRAGVEAVVAGGELLCEGHCRGVV